MRGEDEDLAVASDLEDGSAAVADIEIAFAIEGDAGGDSHAFGVRGHRAVLGDAIDGAVVARGDVQAAIVSDGQAGGIHHLGHERLASS